MRWAILLLFTWVTAAAQDQWKNVYTESAWKDRDRWQKPEELIRMLNLKKDSEVADLGCHEGYMTVKLAGVVTSGHVHAVDLNATRLSQLKSHLASRQISNVETIQGNVSDPHLPANKLDALVILDAYHEMTSHQEILAHIKRALKPGGRLLICEPIADERRKLTRSEQQGKHEIGLSFVLEDLAKAGFEVVKQADPFIDRSREKGDMMWVILATPVPDPK
ncbi:MAG: methyltransferase domain-containing protein [Bacteroidetes bacterium]|nr:methyltransferase domain-containing protein [Bacteroidota bacterium]